MIRHVLIIKEHDSQLPIIVCLSGKIGVFSLHYLFHTSTINLVLTVLTPGL